MFAVQDIYTNKWRAVKIEKKGGKFSLLKYESEILDGLKGITGIPKFYEYAEW